MKKLLYLLSVICYLLSGCLPSRDITDFAMVSVVGIDDGALTLAAPELTLTSHADTLDAALQSLEHASDKHLFLGDARFILIGGDAQDLRGAVDFLLSQPQIHMGSRVFIVEGTAEEVIQSAESPEFLAGWLKNLDGEVGLVDFAEREYLK
ncbi:hypothetical protein FACS1894217_14440 [Clostridia bacterium]|nr:hypothetical protein FACS1894217_14440 [Clostridia bacterium]